MENYILDDKGNKLVVDWSDDSRNFSRKYLMETYGFDIKTFINKWIDEGHFGPEFLDVLKQIANRRSNQ